jgi:hypothetical protein
LQSGAGGGVIAPTSATMPSVAEWKKAHGAEEYWMAGQKYSAETGAWVASEISTALDKTRAGSNYSGPDKTSAAIENTSMTKILDLIASVESPQVAGGYGGLWNNKVPSNFGVAQDLTDMTIQQVLDLQATIARTTGGQAAGKYQFMRETLARYANKENLDFSKTKFSASIQDQLAQSYVNDLTGSARNKQEVLASLSRAWKGLPTSPGMQRGSLTGQGNVAGIGWQEALQQLKEGGIVQAQNGGVAVNVAEGGKNELVTPLDNGMLPGMRELLDKIDRLIKVSTDHKSSSDKLIRVMA